VLYLSNIIIIIIIILLLLAGLTLFDMFRPVYFIFKFYSKRKDVFRYNIHVRETMFCDILFFGSCIFNNEDEK